MCVSAYDTCAQHTFYLVSVCMFSHTSAQIYVRKHSAMCAFIHTYNVYTHLSMCAYLHVMCVCVCMCQGHVRARQVRYRRWRTTLRASAGACMSFGIQS